MERLVLFDIDGTLIQGKHGHEQAFADAFRIVYGLRKGFDWSPYKGYTDQMIINDAVSKSGVGRDVISSRMERCMSEMAISFRRTVKESSIEPIPGVVELLGELKRRGHLAGLVTGNIKPIAEAKLRKAGIWECFSVGGFGDDSAERKELVARAIERAGKRFRAGNNVFLIGDTAYDVSAGKGAGVKTIAVLTGGVPEKVLRDAGCDYLLPDLADTEKVMRIIEGSAGATLRGPLP